MHSLFAYFGAQLFTLLKADLHQDINGEFSFSIRLKGTSINHVDDQGGRGGSTNNHVNPQGGGGSQVLIHVDFCRPKLM